MVTRHPCHIIVAEGFSALRLRDQLIIFTMALPLGFCPALPLGVCQVEQMCFCVYHFFVCLPQEIEFMQNSLNQLKMVQSKFVESQECLVKVTKSKIGKEILVPLTSSVSLIWHISGFSIVHAASFNVNLPVECNLLYMYVHI